MKEVAAAIGFTRVIPDPEGISRSKEAYITPEDLMFPDVKFNQNRSSSFS